MISANSELYSSSLSSLYGLNQATKRVATATERLATNSRLNHASDDIGALSISTRLQTSVTTLRQALSNSTQADSLLQTAFGGLSTITDILTDMLATATQGTSGSLSAADRSALQVQINSFSDEIDSIASSTQFNGIKLLDGSISEENILNSYNTSATAATASLNFTLNPAAGQTVVINGVTLTANTSFAVAGSTALTVANIANAINTSTNTALNGISASAVGTGLTLTSKAGGALGNRLLVNQAASTTSFIASGGTTSVANLFQFVNGAQDGLTDNSVVGAGTIGDSLVDTQTQTKGQLRLVASTNYANGETFSIDNGNGGLLAFTFRNAPATQTEVLIGSNVESTVQNLIETINEYVGNEQYVINQLDFIRDGSDLIIRSKNIGNPTDLVFTNLNFAEAAAGANLSGTVLNSGVSSGINTSGVTNKDFIGTVGGFSATYNSADNVTASLTVGNYTYQATITDTTPAANANVRFSSTTPGGGYFDVELASAGGMSVANQTAANTYAARLDAAFSTIDFSQNRIASSFSPTGNLVGSSFEFQLNNFDKVMLNKIDVTGPSTPGGSAVVEFTVNGELFRSASNLGTSIGTRETIEFQSTTTSNKITLRQGSQDIDLSTSSAADAFETLLETAFGVGTGNGSISFQLGETSQDALEVSIGSAATDKLFAGQSLDMSSTSSAATAQTIIQSAIDEVTSMIAEVGSYQARTHYAADNINMQITTKESARSALADTDIPIEATNLAMATVQAKSAISVLTQTQALQNYMLNLLEHAA
ncbi:MAG: flagellin [Rickettsiales bacterium]